MNEQSGSDTDTLENSQSDDRSQQAVQQAMEYPLEQTIRVQKGAAQLLLSGLEMGTKAQSRSVQLTKDVFDSYITTLERAAQDTEQLTQTATARIQSQGEAMQQEGQQAVSQATRASGRHGGEGTQQYAGQQYGGTYDQQARTPAGGGGGRGTGVGGQGSMYQGQTDAPPQGSHQGQYAGHGYQRPPQGQQYGTQGYGQGSSYAYQGVQQPRTGTGQGQIERGASQRSMGRRPTQEQTSPGFGQGQGRSTGQFQGSSTERESGTSQDTFPETQR